MIQVLARLFDRLFGGGGAPAARRPPAPVRATLPPEARPAAPTPSADVSPAGSPQSARYLLIVAAEAAHQLPHVRQMFRSDPDVHVILDRRRGERRRAGGAASVERRGRERRAPSDYWQDPRFHPVVLVPVGGHAVAAPQPAAPDHLTEVPMIDDTIESRQRVLTWVREGQEILGRTLPALLEQHEGLRRRAGEAEAERDRLHAENQQLRGELGELRGRHQTVLAAQTDIVQSLGKFMGHMMQVLEPMKELADRLNQTPRGGA
jgi:hypothetical protein